MTEPYLDPNNVGIIFLPSYNTYIMNGSGQATAIKFQFHYHEDKEHITLQALLPHDDDFEPVEHGELGVEEMKNLLVHCCENVVRITSIEPVKSHYEHLLSKMIDHMKTEYESMEIGDEIHLTNVLGQVMPKPDRDRDIECIGVFREITLGAPQNIEKDQMVELDFHIPMILIVSSDNLYQELQERGMKAEIYTDKRKYTISEIKLAAKSEENQSGNAYLTDIRGKCNTVLSEPSKHKIKLKGLPTFKEDTLKQADRLSAIIANDSINMIIGAYRQALGLPEIKTQQNRKQENQRLRNRMGNIGRD